MATKPSDLVYGVDDVPPFPRLVALGFQYAILLGVYLIIVVLVARAAKVPPEVTTDLVSLGLIAAAIGTAAQAWNGRFFGSGFLAPPVYSAIYFGPAILAAKSGGLPAVAGMTIFAALVEIGLSRLARPPSRRLPAGHRRLRGARRRPPARHRRHRRDPRRDRRDPRRISLARRGGVVTLGACVAFSIWGRGVFRLVVDASRPRPRRCPRPGHRRDRRGDLHRDRRRGVDRPARSRPSSPTASSRR